jgi:hypothetical protein
MLVFRDGGDTDHVLHATVCATTKDWLYPFLPVMDTPSPLHPVPLQSDALDHQHPYACVVGQDNANDCWDILSHQGGHP